MKEQQEKQIISIDEFEKHVSLNNIIHAGGNAVAKLKKIADSLEYDQFNQLVRFPTLLITGKGEGKSTLGRAFLNTLCLYVREIDASVIQTYNHIIEYCWASHPDRAYIITNIDRLPIVFHKMIYEIVQKKEYTYYDPVKMSEIRYPVPSILVMTSSDVLEVPAAILKHTHYIISHGEYGIETRKLIAEQRMVNANVKYSQGCIRKIVDETPNLNSMINLLRTCLDIIKADYRYNLTLDDVNKAIKLTHGIKP